MATKKPTVPEVDPFENLNRQASGLPGAPPTLSTLGKTSSGLVPKNNEEAITNAAWLLLNGEWPQGIDVPQVVQDRADALEEFLRQSDAGGINLAGSTAAGKIAGVGAKTMGKIASDPATKDRFAAEWAKMIESLTGGSSGGGGSGGASTALAVNPVDSPEEIDAYVRKTYGYMAGYLQDPEIGPILRQAATEGWDEARLRGAVSATNWWKTTSENAREFDALRQLDPKTWQDQVDAQVALIRRQASILGLTISGTIDLGQFGSYDRDYFLAVQSIREGWDPQRLAKAIFTEAAFRPDEAQQAGQVKATADKVKDIAGQYMLTVSDSAANEYAQKMILGEMDEGGVDSLFREQAKGRFPGMIDMIDRGIKPVQFFDTYQQQIASMLEIDPQMIDMMSPKWSPIVDHMRDNGQRSPMTLAETMDYVRNTPEWDQTDNARSEAARVAELLGKTFGAIG